MTFQQELQKSQREWYTHGKKDGVEEGVKQGKEETQIKFVKDMASDGLSIERIAKIAHLTVEEVEEILSSNYPGIDK